MLYENLGTVGAFDPPTQNTIMYRYVIICNRYIHAGQIQCLYAPYIVTLTHTCCNIHIGAGSRYCAHVSHLSVANDYQCEPPNCRRDKGLCPCMVIVAYVHIRQQLLLFTCMYLIVLYS